MHGVQHALRDEKSGAVVVIYTDEEMWLWWSGLSEARRQEILQTMIERAPSAEFSEFAQSMRRQHDAYMDNKRPRLSTKQLVSIRKWDR